MVTTADAAMQFGFRRVELTPVADPAAVDLDPGEGLASGLVRALEAGRSLRVAATEAEAPELASRIADTLRGLAFDGRIGEPVRLALEPYEALGGALSQVRDRWPGGGALRDALRVRGAELLSEDVEALLEGRAVEVSARWRAFAHVLAALAPESADRDAQAAALAARWPELAGRVWAARLCEARGRAGGADPEAERRLGAAVAALLVAWAEANHLGPGARAQGVAVRRAAVASEPFTTAEAANAPVRRLQALLLTHLNPDERELLAELLAQRGFKGDFSRQVLEWCVSVPDPGDALREAWSGLRLKGIAQRERCPPDAGDPARALLDKLGFPPDLRPLGLPSLRLKLERARSRVRVAPDRSEIVGEAIEAAKAFELALFLLVRFTFVEREGSVPSKVKDVSFDRLTLGQMAAVAQDFRGPGILPTTNLPQLRNAFTHPSGELPLEVLRAEALALIEEAHRIAIGWETASPPVFPSVLRVERVEIDRWGRARVIAADDQERTEVVLSDVPLAPGSVFLMRAMGNPMRVDPLIVQLPAGWSGLMG
jgi:hypothetical protein